MLAALQDLVDFRSVNLIYKRRFVVLMSIVISNPISINLYSGYKEIISIIMDLQISTDDSNASCVESAIFFPQARRKSHFRHTKHLQFNTQLGRKYF